MKAGSTNPVCPTATLHFARTPEAFDAERYRQKCEDSKCSLDQTLLWASASPEHRLTTAELRQVQGDMKDKSFHNQ